MLPARSRVRRRDEFAIALRGRRVRAGGVVLHAGSDDSPAAPQASKVGVIVNRAVGSAVVRNRVRRRIRHVMAGRLASIPGGDLVVVRALPDAAAMSARDLAAAIDIGLGRLATGGQPR